MVVARTVGGGSLKTRKKAPDANRKICLFALVWLLSVISGVWPSYTHRSSLDGFAASTNEATIFLPFDVSDDDVVGSLDGFNTVHLRHCGQLSEVYIDGTRGGGKGTLAVSTTPLASSFVLRLGKEKHDDDSVCIINSTSDGVAMPSLSHDIRFFISFG